MTPEQILELAHKAGMAFHMGKPHPAVMYQLERFAKIIEAATRDECAKRVDVWDKAFNTGGTIAAAIRSGT